jgi:predicted metal-dependent phosphotriesterase family hydrolase
VIRTVLGDIQPTELGMTFAHEHLLMTGGWPVMNEPDYRLDSVEKAVEEIGNLPTLGLGALVEMTPNGFGRSARGLQEVSRRTGVHIVATTGLHKVGYYADNHWLHRYSVDQISRLLIEEVEIGMDENNLEGPLIDRTDARAGIVKVATSYHRPGRSIDKLIDAVGIAHQTTGVPVATHNDKGTFGHELLDLFERAGVPAQHVVLGHIDHNPDPLLLGELAGRGAYLAFDRPGRIKYAPDSDTVALVEALVEAGHVDQLLLGSDLARRSYWSSLGGGPGLGYLLTTFLPRVGGSALEPVVKQALTENAARAFSFSSQATS